MKKEKTLKQVFADGLKLARLRMAATRGHYVTPEELASELGMVGQTIRGYEAGKAEPTLEIIDQLMRITGVPPAWPPFSNVVQNSVDLPPAPPLSPPAELVSTPRTKKRRRG